MTSITSSLASAFDRIDDFQAVQAEATTDDLQAAVELLQASVGIDAETRGVLRDRMLGINGSLRAPGHVLLGIIVGLMAAELASERGRIQA